MKGVLTEASVLSILTFNNNLPLFRQYFDGLEAFKLSFTIHNQPNELVDAAYFLPFYDASGPAAFQKFRSSLIDLSNKITARNIKVKAAGIEPVFTLLDPKNLPFNGAI